MKVKELQLLLEGFNPDADIIIHRDSQNYGFGAVDTIKTGVFELNEFGNDFWPDQDLIVDPKSIKSLCIYPEDYIASEEQFTTRDLIQ